MSYNVNTVFTTLIPISYFINMNKQFKFKIPKRNYCDGKKKMVSMRLPEKLIAEVENLAAEYGWNTTEVVTTVLDQFVSHESLKKIPTKGT